MSNLRFPAARDEQGNLVPTHLAVQGKLYNCPFCKSARLQFRHVENKQSHYSTVIGTVHTGAVCTKLRKGNSVSMSIIDIKQLVQNAYSDNAGKEPHIPGEQEYPRKPRGDAKRFIIGSKIQRIVEYNFRDIDDYRLDDGSMLTNHFVAWRNASAVLTSNTCSLGGRILEVEPICCLAQHRTIRGYVKGRTRINGRSITTRLIIDIECANAEIFREVRAKYFVKYMLRGRSANRDYEEWDYAPRYRRLFVLGVFSVDPLDQCSNNKVCKDKWTVCSGDFVNCIGRQTMMLVHPNKQICAHPADMIDLDYLNGWSDDI